MKTCLLNLPFRVRIMRRYNCTYYAPNFLFPPLELMSLGAIIKKWKKDDCILIDAIAEGINLNKVINRLKTHQPDLLVFMAGIESFKEDMQTISIIKSQLPTVKIICLGYLPSQSPDDALNKDKAVDYIIIDEPEQSFSELYDYVKEGGTFNGLCGIAYRNNGRIFVGAKRERITDLDRLPFPDRSLINIRLYNEFLLKGPFTTIQASRGCPFECTFCVRTYGKEIINRSLENVIVEIEEAVKKYNIKTIRFMDDTFTLDKKRVMALCDSILQKNLKFDWSCLSRIDTLDKEMLHLMKKAGCKRIYLGIETGSQRLLDYYRKGYNADLIKERVRQVKANNIESVGFFMVGGMQTEDEFMADMALAKKSNLDYIVVERLTAYPSTALVKGTGYAVSSQESLRREKAFYRDFYLRPDYCLNKLKNFIFNIKDTILGIRKLSGFLFLPQRAPLSRQELI